jgi:hypothetical protein
MRNFDATGQLHHGNIESSRRKERELIRHEEKISSALAQDPLTAFQKQLHFHGTGYKRYNYGIHAAS